MNLENENLEDLEAAIARERNRRMTVALLSKPNVAVRTLQPGFSGREGVLAYCVGTCKEGEPTGRTNRVLKHEVESTWGGDYFMFSSYPGGPSMWLLPPHGLGSMLRLA